MPRHSGRAGCEILARVALIAAATLLGSATAQAEGLRLDPQGAPPAEKPGAETSLEAESPDTSVYARMCDAFGEGFTYSPGTGACIKIGGYVKFGTSFGGGTSGTRAGTEPFKLR